jgi:hypothetical protein
MIPTTYHREALEPVKIHGLRPPNYPAFTHSLVCAFTASGEMWLCDKTRVKVKLPNIPLVGLLDYLGAGGTLEALNR